MTCARACLTRETERTRLEAEWSTTRDCLFQSPGHGQHRLGGETFRVPGHWFAVAGGSRTRPTADTTTMCRHMVTSWQTCPFVLQEMTIVTTIGNAPWKGCCHFGKMADAAREYFDNFDSKDALFLAFYPRIAVELDNGVVSDSFGTGEGCGICVASGIRVCVKNEPISYPGLFPFSLSPGGSLAPRYACVSAFFLRGSTMFLVSQVHACFCHLSLKVIFGSIFKAVHPHQGSALMTTRCFFLAYTRTYCTSMTFRLLPSHSLPNWGVHQSVAFKWCVIVCCHFA